MRGKIVFIKKNPECVSEAIAILGDSGNLLANLRLLYLKYIVNSLDNIIFMIMTYIFHKIIITIFLDITVIESKLF